MNSNTSLAAKPLIKMIIVGNIKTLPQTEVK